MRKNKSILVGLISKRLVELLVLKTDILLLRRIMKKGLEVPSLSSLVLNASVVSASC